MDKMAGKIIGLIVAIVALIGVSWLATVNDFFSKYIWLFWVLVGLLALYLIALIIIDIINAIKGGKH